MSTVSTLQNVNGVSVLVCADEGAAVRAERDALDLIGDAGYQGAEWVVVPAARLDDAFFHLGSGVAGDIVQKFVQYRLGLVVLGDISRHTERSSALRDFVRECNRGRQTWFLTTLGELTERLAP
ncbi:DUF4180 domain-containing protein [Streptomyces sp. NPDC091268]|uniref:DUF4180 domain-containing protein n=1 Tax=Streptomyces sp. NPDC091268 TaxID=3365979 RepID=UPI0038116C78